MSFVFEKVAIVGAGLLGASLGLALRERGLARRISGVGRRTASLEKAKEVGAIDEGTLSLEKGVRGAELVVICTPAASVPDYLDALQGLGGGDWTITDVASTKSRICAHAAELWPADRPFVGSHPMAGSEKYGPEHADAGLYEGSVTFVESEPSLPPGAVECVNRLWSSVGSTVVATDMSLHDALVAKTSHMPHILSTLVAELCLGETSLAGFVGAGFRDTTRIAAGRPEIWRDICLTNDAAILGELDKAIERLKAIRDALRAGDGAALEAFFQRGRDARQAALDS